MRTALLLLMLVAAAPSPEIRYFHYQRPIQINTQLAGQTCFVLDPEIFAHAATQLADVRLYRDSTEIPYIVRVASPSSVAGQAIIPLNPGRRAGHTVFDAAMPPGSYSDVELSVGAHDFLASVTVSGSQQEAPSPETRLGDFTIFDLTRQKLGRSTVLHLPRSDFRFLHFRISGPIAPEKITGILVATQQVEEPKYRIITESSHVAQKGHASVIQLEVPAQVPVERVTFVAGPQPPNFSRDVELSARPAAPARAGKEDREAAPAGSGGNILRLHRVEDGHRIDEERLAVAAPGLTFDSASQWTITVENGDDPPLGLEAVRLEMLERNLCFDAAAGKSYTLYYGDPALAPPQYDYARLFAAQPHAAEAVLGPEEQNPGYRARPDERPFTERHPALLWIALGAVVLLLGWVALRSAKLTSSQD